MKILCWIAVFIALIAISVSSQEVSEVFEEIDKSLHENSVTIEQVVLAANLGIIALDESDLNYKEASSSVLENEKEAVEEDEVHNSHNNSSPESITSVAQPAEDVWSLMKAQIAHDFRFILVLIPPPAKRIISEWFSKLSQKVGNVALGALDPMLAGTAKLLNTLSIICSNAAGYVERLNTTRQQRQQVTVQTSTSAVSQSTSSTPIKQQQQYEHTESEETSFKFEKIVEDGDEEIIEL